jgi:hypothetical protein
MLISKSTQIQSVFGFEASIYAQALGNGVRFG